MRGYYKVESSHVFDRDGFFRTQDGGSLDADGHLHWTGRLSGLIKTGGANVSPVELERVLAAYPGLRVSAAVGVPHPTLGEVVVLCAVPIANAPAPDEAAIQSFVRERLAPYKVPRRVLFFADDEFSYTWRTRRSSRPRFATPRCDDSKPSAPRSPAIATAPDLPRRAATMNHRTPSKPRLRFPRSEPQASGQRQ